MSRNGTVPEVLTLAETARYLRLPQATIKDRALRGEIPGQKVGKSWRFLKTALNDWLRKFDSRTALLEQFGAFADDPTLPEIRKAIYAARGRPETEEEAAD